MRIAVGSDSVSEATDAVAEALRARGHTLLLRGALAGSDGGWAEVGREVGRLVAGGEAEQGVLFCWTGTGVSIAANKVRGVRAALCGDAETARGARAWNDANILCLALSSLTPERAISVLDAWLAGEPDGTETEQIARIE